MAPRVLITDGEQRSALAIARSLGRAGFRVDVCSQAGSPLAGASRYVHSCARVPDPLKDSGRFTDSVAALTERLATSVLLPVTEASLLALLPARSRFRATVPFPDAEVFRAICDKAAVLRRARTLGLAVPRQSVLESPGSLDRLAGALPSPPVVIKPTRSVGMREGRRVKLGVEYAHTWEALRAKVAALPSQAFPVLLQQRIVGPGIGIFLLLWEGRLLASFAHRRLREKPPSGGVSVYRESVPADPELVAGSRRLLEAFAWQGVAMVEYKVDAVTATPYVMEVNGRFWGSLQLAIDAGVDFPALLVAAALGREVAPVTDYRLGVRSRWWWGDLDQLLLRLRHTAEELSLPPDAPSRWRAVVDFMTPWRPGDRTEVLRLSDPRPFVRESTRWLANVLRARG